MSGTDLIEKGVSKVNATSGAFVGGIVSSRSRQIIMLKDITRTCGFQNPLASCLLGSLLLRKGRKF